MSLELQPFNEATKCPMCGFASISVDYCPGGLAKCPYGLLEKHLHRACARCGYRWREACVGTQTEPQEGGEK